MANQRLFSGLETGTYNSLFMLIRKNKNLQKAIDAIDPNDKDMQKLLTEIKQGKFKPDTFTHENCDVFLLRLFKDNKITYPVFFTAYTYLMALIETRNVKYQYEGLVTTPDVRKVESFNLWDDEKNQLSKQGEEYVRALCHDYANFGDFFSSAVKRLRTKFESPDHLEEHFYKQLTAYIGKLDPAERVIIKLNLPMNDFIEQIVSSYPCVKSQSETDVTLHSPSYSIHEWLNKQICSEPMRAQACFGRLSRETLLTWHQNNTHPYPLVSRYVKDNMIEAHGDPYGPYTTSQHDTDHVLYASNASREDRAQLLTLSRFFLTLREELDTNPAAPADFNKNLKALFDQYFDELNDLFLLGYENNLQEHITSDMKSRINNSTDENAYYSKGGNFSATKSNLYEYFNNLKTGKHPEPVQTVIDTAIATLEEKYPELATQAKQQVKQR